MPLVCHMWATCGPDIGHMWATRWPPLQNTCGPHVCLSWEPFQLPHVGHVGPTSGMFAAACHAGGRGSIPGPGTLVGVKTWHSTLELVYLCVFRKRHQKPLVPSIWCIWRMSGEVKDPTCRGLVQISHTIAVVIVRFCYL